MAYRPGDTSILDSEHKSCSTSCFTTFRVVLRKPYAMEVGLSNLGVLASWTAANSAAAELDTNCTISSSQIILIVIRLSEVSNPRPVFVAGKQDIVGDIVII